MQLFINANQSRVSPVRHQHAVNPLGSKNNHIFAYRPRPSGCEEQLPHISSLSISGKKESAGNFFQSRARANPKNSKSSRSISSSATNQTRSNIIEEAKTKNGSEVDSGSKFTSEVYKNSIVQGKHSKVLSKSKDLVILANANRNGHVLPNRREALPLL